MDTWSCFFLPFFMKLPEAAALKCRIHLFRPFSHYWTAFIQNMQWRVTCYFHLILSRKKKPTAEQERLNSTKATFQLNPKHVSKLSTYLKQQQKGRFTQVMRAKYAKHVPKQGEVPMHYIKLFKLGIREFIKSRESSLHRGRDKNVLRRDWELWSKLRFSFLLPHT